MSMTPEEILRSFNQAKFPAKQVKILAELNCSTTQEIERILIEQGVDGRRLPRKKRETPAPKAAQKEKSTKAQTFIMEDLRQEESRLRLRQAELQEEQAKVVQKLKAVQLALEALAEVYGPEEQ